MKSFLGCLVIFLLAACTAPSYSSKQLLQARLDPNREYRTIVTPHFEVHYDTELEELAAWTAAEAERVRSLLAGEFGALPEHKTHIVMVENSDRTNVFTLTFPHDQIFLNPTLPLVSQDVNPYGHWLTWLLIHEYTHILFSDHAGGFNAAVQWMGGAWAKPNMAVPQWLKEGVAVYL